MSHSFRASTVAVVGLASLLFCAGCTPQAATVSGQVTLDGAPLDDANISFVPRDGGQKQAGWATISGGHYAIPETSRLGTGAFRVEIRALRATGEKSSDPSMIPSKEIIPPKYNTRSELSAEIKPGPNRADFSLKTK